MARSAPFAVGEAKVAVTSAESGECAGGVRALVGAAEDAGGRLPLREIELGDVLDEEAGGLAVPPGLLRRPPRPRQVVGGEEVQRRQKGVGGGRAAAGADAAAPGGGAAVAPPLAHRHAAHGGEGGRHVGPALALGGVEGLQRVQEGAPSPLLEQVWRRPWEGGAGPPTPTPANAPRGHRRPPAARAHKAAPSGEARGGGGQGERAKSAARFTASKCPARPHGGRGT